MGLELHFFKHRHGLIVGKLNVELLSPDGSVVKHALFPMTIWGLHEPQNQCEPERLCRGYLLNPHSLRLNSKFMSAF